MDTAVADPDTPNLGVWVASQQALCSRQGILSHFESAGLYINGNDFPLIAGFDARTDVLGIDFLPAPGMLFFTVVRLPHPHGFSSHVGTEVLAGLPRLLYTICSAPPEVAVGTGQAPILWSVATIGINVLNMYGLADRVTAGLAVCAVMPRAFMDQAYDGCPCHFTHALRLALPGSPSIPVR